MNPPNIQEDPRGPKPTPAEIEAGKAALSEITREDVGQAVEGVKSDELVANEAIERIQLPDLIQNSKDYHQGLDLYQKLVIKTESVEDQQKILDTMTPEDLELMRQALELSTPRPDPIEEKTRLAKLKVLEEMTTKEVFGERSPEEEIKAKAMHEAGKLETKEENAA